MKHTTLRVQGVKSVASFIPKRITLENSRRLLCGQLRFPCWHNVVPNSTLSAAVLSEFIQLFRCQHQKRYSRCMDYVEFDALASLRQDESKIRSWPLQLHTMQMNTLYGLTRIKGIIHFESETCYCPNAGNGK